MVQCTAFLIASVRARRLTAVARYARAIWHPCAESTRQIRATPKGAPMLGDELADHRCRGSLSAREESRRRLQNGDRLLQLGVLALELSHLSGLLGGDTSLLSRVDPMLPDPPTQRLPAHPEPGRDRGDRRPLGGILLLVLDHQSIQEPQPPRSADTNSPSLPRAGQEDTYRLFSFFRGCSSSALGLLSMGEESMKAPDQ